jgi:maltose/maltodextrin transport system substrate-binding protein
MEAIALLYNKKLVKQVPNNFRELINIAHKREGYTFLYDLGNFFFSFPLLSANGGYVFKNRQGTLDTSDIGLDNSGAVAGATLLRTLVEQKVIPESTDRSIAFNLFKKGELPFTIDGPWAVNDLKKAHINFGVAPLPLVGDGRPRPFVGVHGFIIRRSSPNKDVAIEFIENYLMTKQGIRSLYDSDPRTPARRDVVEELKRDEILQGFLASAKQGIPMPNVPQMGAVWGAMGAALRSVITSKRPIKEILGFAHQQIVHSLKKK